MNLNDRDKHSIRCVQGEFIKWDDFVPLPREDLVSDLLGRRQAQRLIQNLPGSTEGIIEHHAFAISKQPV
ncbi:hypothetical protein [Brevibacillus nitrificans]|uniref:hypothetical protein n=1 Tax=Brevibacillus nitrificans TaxID=651560 RepID=UPI002857489E|nr:hypothetical protein [Brevibacillus nitrificans]MDR7316250.1 hypothetical protein [Brevibacillus nitrificans]